MARTYRTDYRGDTYHDGGEIRRMEEVIAQRLREVVRESEEARP